MKVKSSHIDSIDHDGTYLSVTFKNGSTYRYNAPEEEFKEMLKSESPGKFLRNNIVPKYESSPL